MPLVSEYISKPTSWYFLLGMVMLNDAANSMVQGGMFGFASIFPPKYMGAMMVGQGINGMLLNSVKMILLFVLPPNENDTEDKNAYYDSLIFLSIFTIILVFSLSCFMTLMKMDFARFYINQAR